MEEARTATKRRLGCLESHRMLSHTHPNALGNTEAKHLGNG